MRVDADLHLEMDRHQFRLKTLPDGGGLEFVIPTLPAAAALFSFVRYRRGVLEQADVILRRLGTTARIRYQGLTLATLGQGHQSWTLLSKTLSKL